ncbi:hypothetical protein V9K67_22155 [Paraflavisolibacter sp. H34]|uniref:hypothetical protein n=1 Tax=Huijunlia imazamoxiresistens TaxID=3127457 RepID=UPI00301ACF58
MRLVVFFSWQDDPAGGLVFRRLPGIYGLAPGQQTEDQFYKLTFPKGKPERSSKTCLFISGRRRFWKPYSPQVGKGAKPGVTKERRESPLRFQVE